MLKNKFHIRPLTAEISAHKSSAEKSKTQILYAHFGTNGHTTIKKNVEEYEQESFPLCFNLQQVCSQLQRKKHASSQT